MRADTDRRAGRTPSRRAAAFGVSLFMLMATWSVAMPLFSSPDENAHFVRSAAIVRGVLVGEGLPASVPNAYWMTAVDIDPQFNAANWVPWCFAPDPTRPACDRPLESTDPRQDVPFTTMGRYPPVAYVIPGLATLAGPNDLSVRLARLFGAALCAALISAAWSGATRRGASSASILLAVTPGTIFLAATVNPSGPEICASIASWTLVTLAMREPHLPASEQVALGGALLVLTTARPIGPVITLLVVGLSAFGAGVSGRTLLERIRRYWVVSATAAVAAVAMVTWHLTIFSANTSPSVVAGEPAISRIDRVAIALGHLPALVAEGVGNYGWLDTPTPTAALWLFLGAVAVMIASAWPTMHVRSRAALVALIATIVAVSVALDLNYYRLLRNFGGQGRHLMPLLVGIPLMAVWRWRPTRSVEVIVASCWAVVVISSATYALRRYSVGVVDGNFLEMFTAPIWSPPLGVVGSLGALTVATAAVVWTVLRSDDDAMSPDTISRGVRTQRGVDAA